jgi:hypothetical protein
MEGSGRDLLKALYSNLPGVQEDHEKTLVRIVGVPAKSRTVISQIQVTHAISQATKKYCILKNTCACTSVYNNYTACFVWTGK